MSIKEFHLFAGIGGGIYGGKLLGHQCCGAVEIDDFCKDILSLRQKENWMDDFNIYGDITRINGKNFKGSFDILCGGFPCQAFSHAAHGKNIPEKNLWGEMFRFVKESNAPVVFGENVTYKALDKARSDLISIGYKVQLCKLSCNEIGGNHRRDRFWLLAVKNRKVFKKVIEHLNTLPKLNNKCWVDSPNNYAYDYDSSFRRKQLKAIGNAQSPFVAATVFRILVNRHIKNFPDDNYKVTHKEISEVFEIEKTWIERTYGKDKRLVHTPTTMANYSCESMMKHKGCRNYKEIFGNPMPRDAEYLMGFPIGASTTKNNSKENYYLWIQHN